MIRKIKKFFPSSKTQEILNNDAQKVATFWGNRAGKSTETSECHWTDSPLIQQHYIHPTISGSKDKNWFMWVKDTFFLNPAEKALSLGCGDGCLERHGAFIDVFKKCDAFDISPEAIEIAKRKAKELGMLERIYYEVQDINRIKLKKDYYDVVFCSMSLHHFEKLEHILYEIENSLKDEGLFITNEYVGPNRFQWPDKQLKIANELFQLIPEKYRLDPTSNKIKNSIEGVTVEHLFETDPSEAVRSADIIPLIEKRFDIIEHIRYGGTLVNLILDNIIVNFDENRSEDMSILKLIFYIEKLLIEENILENNFSLIISRKQKLSS